MYINKPPVTKIKTADRVDLLRSNSCWFEQYESRRPDQMLASSLRISMIKAKL